MPEQFTLGGPYLAYGVICERVLKEADGAVSLIRIIDRFTIRAQNKNLPPTSLNFYLAILLRRGDQKGIMRLSIRPITPSEKELPSLEIPLHFEGEKEHGEEHGCEVAVPMQFMVQEVGLYWFEVKLDGQLATRIPLRIVYEPTVTTPGHPQQR